MKKKSSLSHYNHLLAYSTLHAKRRRPAEPFVDVKSMQSLASRNLTINAGLPGHMATIPGAIQWGNSYQFRHMDLRQQSLIVYRQRGGGGVGGSGLNLLFRPLGSRQAASELGFV